MAEDEKKRVEDIGNYKWTFEGTKIPFLYKEEVRNLQIQKGTLLPEEREIIKRLLPACVGFSRFYNNKLIHKIPMLIKP